MDCLAPKWYNLFRLIRLKILAFLNRCSSWFKNVVTEFVRRKWLSDFSSIVLIHVHISYAMLMLQFKKPKQKIQMRSRNQKKKNFAHLVTSLVNEVRFSRFRKWESSFLLLAISFEWTCSQEIIFLCPPHGNGSFETFTILMS